MSQHEAIVFDCQGVNLVGIVELPPGARRTAVLVVTGGPQYRVGSHRQFTLLCRALAAERFASLRFDFRGSGDSDGDRVPFTGLQADIAAALDQLFARVPELSQVVLLGLCDGASAALMYGHNDRRVAGIIMLNPWVRTTGSLEQARVRGYYPARLTNVTFWKRLLSGKVNVLESLKSFRDHLAIASASSRTDTGTSTENNESSERDFLRDMLNGARQFEGELLVVLSGQDMTAQEYRDLLGSSDDWRKKMSAVNVQQVEVADASHTFSRAEWRDAVAAHCLAFVQRLDTKLK